jgi:hypothetical protein
MKSLTSIMALAVALAVALAWPSVGEAQSKKKSARGKTTAKHYVQRPAKVAKRGSAQYGGHAPCARQVWYGCAGWDPDPNVRDMISRDVGDDN